MDRKQINKERAKAINPQPSASKFGTAQFEDECGFLYRFPNEADPDEERFRAKLEDNPKYARALLVWIKRPAKLLKKTPRLTRPVGKGTAHTFKFKEKFRRAHTLPAEFGGRLVNVYMREPNGATGYAVVRIDKATPL